jgi:hypothetical protein
MLTEQREKEIDMQAPSISSARRILNRTAIIAIVAVAVFITASAAGPQWYEELTRWLHAMPASLPPIPIAHAPALGPPVSVTPMQPVGNDSSASPVPLPLILVRTQRGRNSREGFAQIGVRPESPQTYTSGALLVNGARLTEIYDSYVVLERGGRRTRLYLRGSQPADSPSAQDSLFVGGTAEAAVSSTVSQDTLSLYVRGTPVFAGNRLQGYALYPGRNSSPFSELGLQSGDVLIRLNGETITDASDALSTLQTLLKGAVVSADIERDGATQSISLDGRIFLRAENSHLNPIRSTEHSDLTL